MHSHSLPRRVVATGTSLAAGLALAATFGASAQASVPGRDAAQPDGRDQQKVRHDNLPNPMARQQAKLRDEALEAVANGKAEAEPQRGGGSVVELSSGDSVELFDNDKRANIWTVLSEFGDETTEAGGTAGPLHNQMPEPDRSEDNSTQWTDDFNVAHYDRMFNTGDDAGNSFKDYYLVQSNGQYTVDITTEDWVQVPRNGNYYGDNSNEARGYWDFINDTVDAWYEQKSSSMSDAELRDYLAQFDRWDRYDFDGDGDFNEPDGYIDHFQAIHAGAGEEAGGGVLGDDAIWSHRWYADYTTTGQVGPTVDGRQNLQGGQEIGNTGMYVGDYTVEPENGGLGVFTHEFGHDLGLPDFYDTSGGGENGTGFWTLMSSGSWMNYADRTPTDSFLYGIGGVPNDMGPEEKLFLGWLDPKVIEPGKRRSVRLKPAGDRNSNQAIQVLLPDVEKTTSIGDPFAGDQSWYSDSGDDLSNTLTRDVPAGDEVTVDAQAWYQTEADYDYWYAQYSTDDGATWENLGVFDGTSDWTPVSFSYDAGGQPSTFRFLYKTDGGVSELGVMLDEITTTVDGTEVDTDGAESEDSAWQSNGWLRTTGTLTETFPQYYLMENRAYSGYDKTLKLGPYNFDKSFTKPDHVEHFPYQDGLLVWYVNHSVPDNNTSVHPGSGYALPVDAMPWPRTFSDGSIARNRIQSFDATFGWGRTDRFRLSRQVSDGDGGYETIRYWSGSRRRKPVFNDSRVNRYWSADNPTNSVKVAGVGVRAFVGRSHWFRGQAKHKRWSHRWDKSLRVFVHNPKR